MEEEVQGGPTHGRGRGGRGTRGRGRGRCANHDRTLDDFEDATVGGGYGGAADEDDVDVGMGVGVVELATLIDSGLLMLL